MTKLQNTSYEIDYPVYGATFLNDSTLLVTGGDNRSVNKLTALSINLTKKKKPIKKFRELKVNNTHNPPTALDANSNVILLGCNESEESVQNGHDYNLQKFLYHNEHLKFITSTSLEPSVSNTLQYQKFVKLSHDASIAAIASSKVPTVIHILDPINLIVTYEIETSEEVIDLDISPDGKSLIFISRQAVDVISIVTGRSLQRRIDFQDLTLDKVKFIDNNKIVLALCLNTGGIQLNTISLTNKLKTIKQKIVDKKAKSITSIDVNAKNGVIAFSTNEDSLILVNIQSLKHLKTFTNLHQLSITKIAFSPNGQLLASVSSGKTVNITEIPDALGIETHKLYSFFIRSFQIIILAIVAQVCWTYYQKYGPKPRDTDYFSMNQKTLSPDDLSYETTAEINYVDLVGSRIKSIYSNVVNRDGHTQELVDIHTNEFATPTTAAAPVIELDSISKPSVTIDTTDSLSIKSLTEQVSQITPSSSSTSKKRVKKLKKTKKKKTKKHYSSDVSPVESKSESEVDSTTINSSEPITTVSTPIKTLSSRSHKSKSHKPKTSTIGPVPGSETTAKLSRRKRRTIASEPAMVSSIEASVAEGQPMDVSYTTIEETEKYQGEEQRLEQHADKTVGESISSEESRPLTVLGNAQEAAVTEEEVQDFETSGAEESEALETENFGIEEPEEIIVHHVIDRVEESDIEKKVEENANTELQNESEAAVQEESRASSQEENGAQESEIEETATEEESTTEEELASEEDFSIERESDDLESPETDDYEGAVSDADSFGEAEPQKISEVTETIELLEDFNEQKNEHIPQGHLVEEHLETPQKQPSSEIESKIEENQELKSEGEPIEGFTERVAVENQKETVGDASDTIQQKILESVKIAKEESTSEEEPAVEEESTTEESEYETDSDEEFEESESENNNIQKEKTVTVSHGSQEEVLEVLNIENKHGSTEIDDGELADDEKSETEDENGDVSEIEEFDSEENSQDASESETESETESEIEETFVEEVTETATETETDLEAETAEESKVVDLPVEDIERVAASVLKEEISEGEAQESETGELESSDAESTESEEEFSSDPEEEENSVTESELFEHEVETEEPTDIDHDVDLDQSSEDGSESEEEYVMIVEEMESEAQEKPQTEDHQKNAHDEL